MAYRIEPHETVTAAVRRIAHEEIDAAIADLDDGLGVDRTEAIHDCRKRCKRIRGLVRLVRPVMDEGDYRAVNAGARDAASKLSYLRDSAAAHETFVSLVASAAQDDAARAVVEAVESMLRERRSRAETPPNDDDHGDRIATAREHLTRLGERIDTISLQATDWDAIGPGLTATYRRGRSALALTQVRPTGRQFHRWRKSAKYTWHQLQLLGPTAPSILDPLADAFHDLSGVLGSSHDLDLLAEWMRSGDAGLDGAWDLAPLSDLTDDRRRELEHAAISLGMRLYAERPKRFTARLGRYWEIWADEAVPGSGPHRIVSGD